MTSENKVICPVCGAEMNHHATKIEYTEDAAGDPVFSGIVKETYTCPNCGNIELRAAD